MPTLHFTADWHLLHRQVLTVMPSRAARFADYEAMVETLVARHNERVEPRDTVYHLGDDAFGPAPQVLRRLHGRHILITGGAHDQRWARPAKVAAAGYAACHDVLMVKHAGQLFWLAHYPYRCWPQSHYGSLHLHGHLHSPVGQPVPGWGRCLDVGVDGHDFAPWSLAEVLAVLAPVPIHHGPFAGQVPPPGGCTRPGRSTATTTAAAAPASCLPAPPASGAR